MKVEIPNYNKVPVSEIIKGKCFIDANVCWIRGTVSEDNDGFNATRLSNGERDCFAKDALVEPVNLKVIKDD